MKIKYCVFNFNDIFNNINRNYINLLKENNIEICVILCKKNESQTNILNDLNIKYISFYNNDKLKTLKEWCNTLNVNIKNDIAYMGYDLKDINIMKEVNISGCSIESDKKCIEICELSPNFISYKKGEECIIDFCDFIINNNIIDESYVIKEIKDEFNYQINNYNIVRTFS